MKKAIFILYFLYFPLICYSLVPHSDNQEWIYGQLYSENKNMICDFVYFFNKKNIEIELGTSGYLFKSTFVSENEKTLEFGFYKIWTGAEEIDKTDSRDLLYYHVVITQEDIENSKKGNLKPINNIKPVLILEDSVGSVMRHSNKPKSFNVKLDCYIYEKASMVSKQIYPIKSTDIFSIIDIVQSEETKDEVWLKIDTDNLIGYIPLSSLADDWKVVKNDLDKFSNVQNISAVCNDNRVRIRAEPNLNCETLGFLNKGDKVYIKNHSEKKQTIDNESWYWYKVDNQDYPDGWVYGKYLDIEE